MVAPAVSTASEPVAQVLANLRRQLERATRSQTREGHPVTVGYFKAAEVGQLLQDSEATLRAAAGAEALAAATAAEDARIKAAIAERKALHQAVTDALKSARRRAKAFGLGETDLNAVSTAMSRYANVAYRDRKPVTADELWRQGLLAATAATADVGLPTRAALASALSSGRGRFTFKKPDANGRIPVLRSAVTTKSAATPEKEWGYLEQQANGRLCFVVSATDLRSAVTDPALHAELVEAARQALRAGGDYTRDGQLATIRLGAVSDPHLKAIMQAAVAGLLKAQPDLKAEVADPAVRSALAKDADSRVTEYPVSPVGRADAQSVSSVPVKQMPAAGRVSTAREGDDPDAKASSATGESKAAARGSLMPFAAAAGSQSVASGLRPARSGAPDPHS